MGAVTFSVDAELAWGFHDLERPLGRRLGRRAGNARRSWRRLLALFEEFDVAATWAVVGHLFLDECDGIHGNHPAPDGWFDRDPGGTPRSAPDWFAPDLVTEILDAPAKHEIASHSFSHVEFGSSRVTKAMAEAEVRGSMTAAKRLGIDLKSFCYPRNAIGYRDVLAEHGFTCYRGPAPHRWYDDSPLRTMVKFGNYTVGSSAPPLVRPFLDECGLVNVPASLHLFSFEGVARRLTEPIIGDAVVRQACRGINAAVGTDRVLHLWLHPNDLVRTGDVDRMRSILSHLARRRDEGELVIRTMSEVAATTAAKTDHG